MNLLRCIICALTFLACSAAFAGYAQLAPPPAFQSVGGVTTINVGTAANAPRYVGGHVLANASLNLGARTVTVPVAMRVAANAASFAVTRMNPWIAGATVAYGAWQLLNEWFSRHPDPNQRLRVGSDGVIRTPDGSPILDPLAETANYDNLGVRTLAQFIEQNPWKDCGSDGYKAAHYGSCSIPLDGGRVMVGTHVTCARYGQTVACAGNPPPDFFQPKPVSGSPATSQDIAPFANIPVNPQVLPELDIPLPVEPVPILNPEPVPVGDIVISPQGNPAPQVNPRPEPLRYPDGEPVPIPGTDPPMWRQPWYEVRPAPTPDKPWQVIISPVVTEVPSPAPVPDPDGTFPPKPEKPPVDIPTDCEKFPGSIGCMPAGPAPQPQEIPRLQREISAQAGPVLSGGSCPSNLELSFGGYHMTAIDMAQPCAWIGGYVRPVFILLAMITAVFIVRSSLKKQ